MNVESWKIFLVLIIITQIIMLLRNEMLCMKEVKENSQNLDREKRLLKCRKKCKMVVEIEKRS